MVNPSPPQRIKFLCSYGGRILPRYPDGKLRYLGGQTRVLSVDSSISAAELLVRMGEMCGSSVSLRCQLPADDLDALVSVTSDEDLANLIEEYDQSLLKIRAFFYAPKSVKMASPPPKCVRRASRPAGSYPGVGGAGKTRAQFGGYQYRSGLVRLVHSGYCN